MTQSFQDWAPKGPAEQRVVLDSAYYARTQSLRLPPGFNSVYEANRWTAAQSKCHGICASPHAIVCRCPRPEIAMGGAQVTERGPLILSQLGIEAELSVWVDLKSRSQRAAIALYFGCAVADPAALKLLCSTS